MGLPFRSGDVFALRRFAASSIGRVHVRLAPRALRRVDVFQDVPAEQGCARYLGPQLRRSLERPIEVRWTGANAFSVKVEGGRAVQWDVTLAAPPANRAMNAMASIMPDALWRNESALAMAVMARRLLGAGRMALAGRAPSGQHFVANPLVAWSIPSSRACVEGVDVGEPGPLPEQEHLADFWIPQRGLFVIGQAFFEPFDPARHRCEVHAEA